MLINIVSPHQDDAALSLGATIDHLVRNGHSVNVVNCFTRTDFAPHATSVPDVAELRRAEDAEFARQVGPSLRIRDLGLRDAPLRLRCRVSDVRRQRRLRATDIFDAETVLLALGELEGVVLLPLGLGNHIDHRVALEAGLRSASLASRIGFYEDLPYASELEGCCIVSAVRRVARRAAKALEPAVIGSPTHPGVKRVLISAYKSQISNDQANAIVEYGRKFGGCERLWLTRELARELVANGVDVVFCAHHPDGLTLPQRIRCFAHGCAAQAYSALRSAARITLRGESIHEAIIR